MPIDPELWAETLSEIVRNVLAWLPVLGGALLLLILGWIVARLAQALLSGLLRRVGFDRVAERAGLTEFLVNAGFEASASRLLARIVYWLVLLLFLLAAAETLRLQGVVDTLEALVLYLPSVLAATLILLLGSLVASVVGDGIGALMSQAGVRAGPLMGQMARYVLLGFVAILALGQLGVETTLLTTVTTVLVTALALALALAFGLGSRDLARNIMAGFHLRDLFVEGQQVRIGAHEGPLVQIGAVKSTIETDEGLVTLANARLVEEEVTVVAQAGSTSQET